MSEAQARALSADPRVKFVEENGVVRANTTQTGATWGLDRIDQRELPLEQLLHLQRHRHAAFTPTSSTPASA